MPHRKPLLIQSGRQPFEIVILMTCIISGLVGLLVGETSITLQKVLGDWTWTWSLSLFLGSTISMVGVCLKPPLCLLTERIGMMWLGCIFLAYGLAIALTGEARIITSATLVLGLGIAAGTRSFQISKDLRKISLALQNPVLASPEPRLADPIKGDADHV